MSREPERSANSGGRARRPSHGLLEGLPFVLVGLPLLLMLIDWLIGFPPSSIARPAFLWGGGLGFAAFTLLLLRGWRTEWVWYPVVFGMAVLGGAMIAVAAVAVVTYFLP